MASARFPLKMADGTKVRTLEELREHFDEDSVLDYFEDGMLIRWLEDRFYEDEAEALRNIDKSTSDYPQSIWDALGINGALVGLDKEALARLAEKEKLLQAHTDDSAIIAKAAQTAFDQEDLADLLDRGINTIYLCGEEFRVPMRPDVTYEGIFGTPQIIIKATSDDELDEKNIVLRNVELSWGKKGGSTIAGQALSSTKTWLVPREQLQAMAAATFKEDFDRYQIDSYPTFLMVDEDNGTAISNLTNEQKKAAISLICGTDYTEGDIVHLRISNDMSEGWAFTADSFCIVARASMGVRAEQLQMHNIYTHTSPSEWAGERKLMMQREEEIIPYTSLSKSVPKISNEMGNMCHVFGYYSGRYADDFARDKENFKVAVNNRNWSILNNHGLFLLDGSGIIWYDEMFGYRKSSGKQQDLDENDTKKKRKGDTGTWPLVRFLANMKNIFQRKENGTVSKE